MSARSRVAASIYLTCWMRVEQDFVFLLFKVAGIRENTIDVERGGFCLLFLKLLI